MEKSSIPLLECKNMEFAFTGRPPLLQEVTLQVEAGDFILITGPSGSGKSTFLRILARFLTQTAGSILFHGQPIEDCEAPQYRRRVAYLHQTPVLVDDTVRHNLLLPFSFKTNGHLVAPPDDLLVNTLGTFLLEGLALDHPAKSLSGGQMQRLCLMRSVLLEPEIMLLDEPVSALDHESRQAVEVVVETLCRDQGIAVLAVSHQPLGVNLARSRVFELKGARFTVREPFVPFHSEPREISTGDP